MSAFPKDEVDRINEEFTELQGQKQSEPLIEKSITEPLADKEQREMQKQAIMELVNDQRQQREEIDGIKDNIQSLAGKMGELVEGFNKMSELMANPQQMGQAQDQHAKFQMITELLNSKIGDIILSRFQPQQQTTPQFRILDPNVLQEQMETAYLKKLETGSAIEDFIANALKKKATKEVINQTFKQMGETNNEHEPA